MASALVSLIQDILSSMGTTLTEFLQDLYWFAFYIEDQFSGADVKFDFNGIYKTIYAWGLIFLVIIFTKKMIETYFLFKTGEEDQSPVKVVIGLIEAVIIDITFGWIYTFVVKIGHSFYMALLNGSGFPTNEDLMNKLIQNSSNGIFTAILILIMVCMMFGIIWQMIRRGLQLLIMRCIVPLTTIGLLSSNGGAFSQLVKKFLQNIFSVIIQLMLMQLSLALILAGKYVYTIACLALCLNGPEFLQDFLAGVGGVGLMGMAEKGVSFMHHASTLPGQIGQAVTSPFTTGKAVYNVAKAGGSAVSQIARASFANGTSMKDIANNSNLTGTQKMGAYAKRIAQGMNVGLKAGVGGVAGIGDYAFRRMAGSNVPNTTNYSDNVRKDFGMKTSETLAKEKGANRQAKADKIRSSNSGDGGSSRQGGVDENPVAQITSIPTPQDDLGNNIASIGNVSNTSSGIESTNNNNVAQIGNVSSAPRKNTRITKSSSTTVTTRKTTSKEITKDILNNKK